ncbi:hypothetical protein ACOME3_002614 [Neoechinorhynchus agilis]
MKTKRLHRRHNPEITIIGRGALYEAAFNVKQLRHLLNLPDLSVSVSNLTEPHEKYKSTRKILRFYELFNNALQRNQGSKRLKFLFLHSPLDLVPDKKGKVKAIHCLDKCKDQVFSVKTDLSIACFGYKSNSLIHTGEEGYNIDKDQRIEPGLYVAGWACRGPKGYLTDTLIDAEIVVTAIKNDLEKIV